MIRPIEIRFDSVNYHEIVRDMTDRNSVHEAIHISPELNQSGQSGALRALVFNTGDCISRKHLFESGQRRGIDTDGSAFLPWCLMRCAEAAKLLSINIILIVCDSPTWEWLEQATALVSSITGIRILKANGVLTPSDETDSCRMLKSSPDSRRVR